MTHSSFDRRLLAVLAIATLAATAADAASPARQVRPAPDALKKVALRQAPARTAPKAPAPAPRQAPVSHGNQDGDRFLYDSCGCSGGQ